MSGWAALGAELDAWAAAGRPATFWWRDDDATHPTPALDRLLALRARTGLPIAVAVIPARAVPEMAEQLHAASAVTVMQHGWAHLNHAPLGASKAELGPHRPLALILGELARGWIALDRLFPRGWSRALVPPHNRIAPALVAALPAAGYTGLSTYNPRKPAPGLAIVNSHADLMNWTTRAFLGEDETLGLVTGHLQARRAGRCDAAEPTGILTHHLAHDDAAWAFLDRLLATLRDHPAAAWPDPRALLARP